MAGERAGGRRLVGALVLVLVLGGLVVSNRASATRVTGTPVATWPQPPPVGSCVDTRGGFAVVPCDERHDAEVTAAYGPLDPMVTDTARDPMYDPCDAAAKDYLGADAAGGTAVPGAHGWRTVGLAYAVEPMTAPPDQRAGAYAWQVCLVHPAVPARYAGTVSGATVEHAPAAYRTCLDVDGAAVSCTRPHAGELLAVGVSSSRPLSAFDRRALATAMGRTPSDSSDGTGPPAVIDPVAALLAEQLAAGQILLRAAGCPDVAGRLLDTGDPTYGGVLSTGTDYLASGLGVVRAVDPADASQQATDGGSAQTGPDEITTVGAVGCTIHAPDGRSLTGSLVGNGDRPPALTRG